MNLALFDFDGTITVGDTWTPFMRTAVRPARVVAGRVLLAPAYVAYKSGVMTAGRVREMAARIGFTGETAAAVHGLGAQYARDTLPAMVRPRATKRIAWHQARGDEVVVVSASLDVYLAPWCEERGLPCVCTTLEERNGRLTGRCVDGDCCGEEKVRRLRERYVLSRYDEIYAYGDTPDDQPMLTLAHRKFYRWQEV